MDDNNDIEKLFSDASLSTMDLPRNKEAIKNMVLHLGYRKSTPGRRQAMYGKIAFFITGCISLAAIGLFLNIEDNEIPGYTNALGGIWSTYSDSLSGGTSTVWPPVSSMCQNNFIKSTPGYGNKGYAVQIKGVAGTSDSSFLGVKTFLSERAACPRCVGIDVSMYKGIRFKMKGRAGSGTLHFMLPHLSKLPSADMASCQSITNSHDYQTPLTGKITQDWTEVKLAFKRDFSQPDKTPVESRVNIRDVLENASCIQWHWIGIPGQSIELWIDDVELY